MAVGEIVHNPAMYIGASTSGKGRRFPPQGGGLTGDVTLYESAGW